MRAIVLCLLLTLPGFAQIDEYCNPLDVLVADPQVLRHEGTYYLYGTSVAFTGYYAWSSTDLVNWRWHGLVYQKSESSWGKYHFWAPEVVERDGVFYLFYTSGPIPRIAPSGKAVCLATAESPLGPFHEAVAPFVETRNDNIDGHVFFDDDGSAWLYFVLERDGNRVMVAPLAADLLSLSAPPTQCIEPDHPWEFSGPWGVNEGPFVLKHKGWYYMLYSGSGFSDPRYSVGFATASSPKGPWSKYAGNPILSKTGRVSGPGHNCVIASPDGSELFCVYHTHMHPTGGGPRQLAIDRMRFVDSATGPAKIEIDGPTHTPQAYPSGANAWPVAVSDSFESEIDRRQWLVFQESDDWACKNGRLVLRGSRGDVTGDGRGLRDLFLQYAPKGDFAASADVGTDATATLWIWQDHENFARLAASPSGLEVGRETNGAWSAKSLPNPHGSRLRLQLEHRGAAWQFSAGDADGEGQPVGAPFEWEPYLPQVGLGAEGRGDARFGGFQVVPGS